MNFLYSKTFLKLLALLISWRVTLFSISAIAPQMFVYLPSFPYAFTKLPAYNLPQWLYSWANFDGVHYLTISEKGYFGTGLIQAFFPLFPLLTRFFNVLIGNHMLSGLLISNLAFLTASILFFKLIQEKFDTKTAWATILFFLVFPTSFFGVALYNESLFLTFVFASFLFSERRWWFFAGCMAGFASATRVVGIFIVPALLIELLYSNYQKETGIISVLIKHYKKILSILIGSLGLLLYMFYLYIVFDDPLYFFHLQSQFGSGRENTIVLLPQVVWRGLKIILTVPFNLRWWTYFQELFFTLGTFFLLFLAVFKRFKMPFAWIFFAVMATLLPTTTGTLSSMPRYVFVAFPIFVILALLCKNNYIKIVVLLVFSIALICNTALFIQGYWIS